MHKNFIEKIKKKKTEYAQLFQSDTKLKNLSRHRNTNTCFLCLITFPLPSFVSMLKVIASCLKAVPIFVYSRLKAETVSQFLFSIINAKFTYHKMQSSPTTRGVTTQPAISHQTALHTTKNIMPNLFLCHIYFRFCSHTQILKNCIVFIT